MADATQNPGLGARTLAGAGWLVAWRFTTRGLGIVSTVVMVRMLKPQDFGLVALATAFAQSIDAAASIGVREALVRAPEINDNLYSTGFTLNMLRGLLMAACMAACAVPVANFFDDSRLSFIIYALAFTSFLSTVENTGIVEFRRGMSFDKEFLLSAVPRLVGVAASITGAILLRNYLALIGAILISSVVRFVLTYWLHPFRPWLTLRSWRQIIMFSFWSWVGTVGMIARDRIDSFVIGRVLGPLKVGVYSLGWEIGSLTSTELVEPLTTALYAGFSAANREGSNVGAAYFKAIALTMLVTLPAGVGLSAIADPVVRIAFGPLWLEAVPLVQVFAIVCMVKVVAYFSTVLFIASGLIHVQVRILFAGLAVRAALLLALIVPLGLRGAVVAACASVAVEELLFLFVTFRHFHLRPANLLREIWRPAVAAAAMAAVLVWEGIGWQQADSSPSDLAWVLVIGVISGAVTYVVALASAWFVAGRPDGAERMFIELIGGTIRRAMARIRLLVLKPLAKKLDNLSANSLR